MTSARSTLRRIPDRGVADPARLHDVLDRALLCHVGFAHEGQPYVLPMAYVRRREHLLLHGSAASRTLRALASGVEACVTITLLDGIVLARSAFHHSMNYRSVVAFGRAVPIEEVGEKRRALDHLVEVLIPGRGAEVRGPSESELKATTVVEFPLDDALLKCRSGAPGDDPADMDGPAWAGVIPLEMKAGEILSSPDLAEGVAMSDAARKWASERPLR